MASANTPDWVITLRGMIKAQFRLGGYTVRNEKGSVILQKRWKDGTRQNAVLPLPWDPGSSLDVLDCIRKVNEQMTSGSGVTLKEAVALLKPVESHTGGITTNWDDVAARYREHLTGSGRVKPEVFDFQHRYVLQKVLAALAAPGAPTTAKGVLQKLAYGEPGTRGRVVRIERAAAFFRFAVSEVGMDSRWSPPQGQELVDIKGKRPPNAQKSSREGKAAYLLDDAFLELYDSITDRRWKLAIGLLGVFGLRGVELKYIEVRGQQLFCSYRKRSGKGEPTPPRFIEPLDPPSRPGLGQQLLLELSSGITALPPLGSKDGETSDKLAKHLRRNATWQRLGSESEARNGDRLKIYSFRHGYAYRSSMTYNLPLRVAAKLMGHSIETHMRDYGEALYGDDLRQAVQQARDRIMASV